MKKLFVICCMAALAYAGVAAGPLKASGLSELDRFSGTWHSPGTLLNTPYSKAGTAVATTTCAWSGDKYFMICQQSVTLNGHADHALSVYTYDPSKGQYRFYHVGTNGGAGSAIVIAGKTVTYTDTFTDAGKQVTIRTQNVWDDASSYHWRTEYSTNSGETWSLMASGTAQRE